MANTQAPFAAECALLERILVRAEPASSISAITLDLVERVATGQTGSITPESEVQVGLKAGELRQHWLNELAVRICAFQKLGETGLPEAVEFLERLKPTDVGD